MGETQIKKFLHTFLGKQNSGTIQQGTEIK
jgi:hypothetical protein